MALVSGLIWLTLGAMIGGSIAIGFANMVIILLSKKDRTLMMNIINGKSKNNIKLDGETININRFKEKNNDGIINVIEFGIDLKKTSPQVLNQVKKPFWRRILYKNA